MTFTPQVEYEGHITGAQMNEINRGPGDVYGAGFKIPIKISSSTNNPDPDMPTNTSTSPIPSPNNTFHTTDIDGDGIPNSEDDDMDGDGVSNNIDTDIDGDNISNNEDSTPNGESSSSASNSGVSGIESISTLVSTGASLWVNVIIAVLMILAIGYFMFRDEIWKK